MKVILTPSRNSETGQREPRGSLARFRDFSDDEV